MGGVKIVRLGEWKKWSVDHFSVRLVFNEISAKKTSKTGKMRIFRTKSSISPKISRIIPFVAADALVKDKESTSPVTAYPLGSVGVPPELRPTDVSASGTPGNFYDIVTQENRFSPPVETEGGFVPREPSYFEAPYHSTDLNLEIGTGVTVVPADITNPHRKSDEMTSECLFEGRPYHHGELVPNCGHCIICICYYGEIACSDEKCPPVKFGCQRIPDETNCCGKIVCGSAPAESPTVVLDRAKLAEPLKTQLSTPDPFRDVIRTEPAPDLPSLIEDMIPYLEHRISTTPLTFTEKIPIPPLTFDSQEVNKYDDVVITTEEPPNNTNISSFDINENFEITTKVIQKISNESVTNYDDDDIFSFDSVLDLLFSGTTQPPVADVDNRNVSMVGKVSSIDKKISIEKVTSATEKLIPTEKNFPGEEKVFLDTQTLISTTKNVSTVEEIFLNDRNMSTTEIAPLNITNGAMAKLPNETEKLTSKVSKKKENEPPPIGGLLKLAGCNIYGRMYRVGRIIVELSTPCLECRCTEIGVQCKQLEC